MGALSIFSNLLRGAGRARGMGAGFAGRAPRNFSPLGQAASTAAPVARPLSGNATQRIVGNRVVRGTSQPGGLNTAQKVGTVSAAGALTAGGAAAAKEGGFNIEEGINQIGPAIDQFIGGLNFPGQQALSQFGRDQEKRGFGSLLELSTPLGFLVGDLIPNSQPKDPLTLREQYGGSGDMDADDAATYNADTGKYTFNSDVVPPAPQLPPPPSQDLPPLRNRFKSWILLLTTLACMAKDDRQHKVKKRKPKYVTWALQSIKQSIRSSTKSLTTL